jgi:hypothetical protein
LPPLPPPSPLGSLEHAQQLLDRGDLQGALAEARAAHALRPNDAAAQKLAAKLEADAVVEQRIRNAREALKRGDKDAALEEAKLGLFVNPKDPRLLDIFREATQ